MKIANKTVTAERLVRDALEKAKHFADYNIFTFLNEEEAIEEAKAKLIAGEIKVFDTSTFTVGGKALTTYTADIVDMGDFKPETEAIEAGAFTESSKRSAPYFDIKYIDGISE